MEIPIIGRFFKGKPPAPVDNLAWVEDELRTGREPHPPLVDRETVRHRISESLASPVGAEEIKEATQDLLEELLRDSHIFSEEPKFLREGTKVVIGGVGAHVAYARVARMIPDDAGSITSTRDDPSGQALVIRGGSFGLGIPPNNANRPDTLEILRRIAPNVTFKED